LAKFFQAYSLSFLFTKVLAISILIIAAFVSIDLLPIKLLSHLLIILQVWLVFDYRKFKPFALFLLFTIPYTLVAFFHFNDNTFPLHLGNHIDFDSDKYYIKTFVIVSLFWSSLTLVLPSINKSIIINKFIVFKNQPVIFYFIIIIQTLIMILGRSGNSIFDSGGYGSIDSQTTNLGGTAIFEYFLVFYPIAYVFSGNNRFRIILLAILASIYSIKAILFGGRVEALQCLLMMYLLHLDNDRISLFRLLRYSILPILFFLLFGFFRASPNSSILEIVSILKENYQFAGFTFFGNQIDVFYSSTRLFGLIDLNVISFIDRIYIFLFNFFAIIVPYSFLPEKANMAAYLQDVYTAGGGGFLPMFFYVYLSYFGVLFIGIIIGLFVRKAINISSSTSSYWVIYLVMLLSTYPRWYAYSSNVVYKFCFYSIFILWLFNKLITTINKLSKK
jgi:hypothetical protein